jgi:hypothetical protein
MLSVLFDMGFVPGAVGGVHGFCVHIGGRVIHTAAVDGGVFYLLLNFLGPSVGRIG